MIDIKTIKRSQKRHQQGIRGLLRKSSIEPHPLRSIVDEVFYATQGGPFNIRTLAARVSQDQIFEEKLIQITDCPYYAGKTPIPSMAQLIQRLGPTGFRCVAMQAFLELEIFESETWQPQLLDIYRYSVVVAHISRIISRLTSVHGDTAFLCGLLHRIGMAVPLRTLPDNNSEPALAAEIWSALEICHPILGNLIVKAWGMNEDLQVAIGIYGLVYHEEKPNMLSACTLLAETLATQLGFSIKGNRRRTTSFREPDKSGIDEILAVLGLSQNDTAIILEESKLTLKNALTI